MTKAEAKKIGKQSVWMMHKQGYHIDEQLWKLPILDFCPDKIQERLSSENLHDNRASRFLDDVRCRCARCGFGAADGFWLRHGAAQR